MYYKGSLISRVAGRVRRDVLRLPFVRALDGYKYLQALEAHSTRLPVLDQRDLSTLETLRRVGVCVLPVQLLALPETLPMFAALDCLVEVLRGIVPGTDNAPRATNEQLAVYPEVYLWGLNERLLNLAENYVQLPVCYHGVSIRREMADGVTNDVRQWHMDPDDRRMFRLIIYLNDVERGGGPFEYIERERSKQAARTLRYGSGFVSDLRMSKAVPVTEWKEVVAPSGHAVIADTSRVFHRAQAPRIRDRYSATFTWKSTTPSKLYPPEPLPAASYDYIRSRLSARQLAALLPA